jgi:hypothetical protein
VVRKWSYIITFKSFLSNPIVTFSNFKFKIFRKNTRFKKYNLSVTSFIRKYPISRKRRFNLKFHVILSSEWVKQLFNLKQLSNSIQSKFVFSNLVYTPYKVDFTYNLTNLIGLGKYSLNFTRVNPYLSKVVLQNKYQINFTSSSSLNNLLKLNNLGFLFSHVSYSNNKYPLNKPLKQYLNSYQYNLYNVDIWNFILNLVLKNLLIIYKLLKLTTLPYSFIK